MNPYDPTPAGPTNLTGAPARHPVYAVPLVQAYNPVHHVPPPAPMPTLKLSPNPVKGNMYYTLYLHESIQKALCLRDGQPISLTPPSYGSIYWHLDLRKSAPYKVAWYGDTRARVNRMKLPLGLVGDGLVLHLMTTTPEYADYYPLIPSNAFTP